ncbi:hypothetical protein ACEPAG_4408 [Sanghuangporus baumii]
MAEQVRPVTPPQLPRRGRRSDHPRMIGPWKIGRTIGKGAMGVVRIARHAKTGKYAAIKIMSKLQVIQSRRSLKNMEDDAERIMLALEREIVVMKLVDHPNIMHLYDVWETSGELYLILEYVEGGELFDYIIERGRLSETEALDYFQQLIGAMDYCHRLNIAHRDLKPENILLDKDKTLKVADFGMAAWQPGDSLLKTSCGSPHYAAPEVISSKPYDGAISDIWSCGIILFALLAGRLPFDDEDICALLGKVSAGKFNMPSDINPKAQDLVRRMLEKDVTKRIKISDIMKHPWFTSQPLRNQQYSAPTLDEITRPIKKASEIDVDIFGNLRTLWHGASDDDIIEGLINEERTWEKVVYTLLMKYRSKCYENYNEELERARSQRRTERRRKRAELEKREGKRSPSNECPSTPPQTLARPDAPTPRRAGNNDNKSSNSRPASLPPPPARHTLRPVSRHAAASDMTPNILGKLILSPSLLTPSTLFSSPQPPTSPASPIWQVLDVTPPPDVPELHDERVQRYLQEIIDRLNAMQKQPGELALSPSSSNGATPPLDPAASFKIEPLRTPGKSRAPSVMEVDPDFTYVLVSQSEEELDSRGLGISAPATDKENQGRVFKKSSLRKKGDTGDRRALADRRVQIVLPPPVERKEGKHRRVSYDSSTSHSPTYSISEGSSFNITSTPKISWFTNLFKPRTGSFRMMSTKDLDTTCEECRRLLANAGVNFVLMDNEDPRVTFLRCHLDEVRDPAGVMATVKAVKFRVEVRRLDMGQTNESPYIVSVDMILEKGSLSSFRLVHQRIRRDWDLDIVDEDHLDINFFKPTFSRYDTKVEGRKRRMTYPNNLLEIDEYMY